MHWAGFGKSIPGSSLLADHCISYRGKSFAKALWGGVMLYLIYTFLIYTFGVHFNSLFIIYCFILGLSFYSFIHFLTRQNKEPIAIEFKKSLPVKVVGIYFLIIASLFYLLWLSEIIPAALQNTIPKSLIEIGLFTNPVHVIDLSLFLPGLFITGVLVLRKKRMGLLLVPVMLTFFILMDISIAFLAIMLAMRGFESNAAITVVMMTLALFSLILLIWYLRNIKQPS
jgi:hypothetical protein